jgi:hypothetical protein
MRAELYAAGARVYDLAGDLRERKTEFGVTKHRGL